MTDKIFIAMMRASGAHTAASRERFQQMELTEGQPKVLFVLRRNEGILQKDLANLCNVSQPTLTVLLEKMVKRGLVRKEVCSVSGGKRGYQIFMTELGKEKSDQIEQMVDDLEEKSLSGFSEQETKTLFELLDRVEQNLS